MSPHLSLDTIDLPPGLLRDGEPDVTDLLPTVSDPGIGVLQPILVRPGPVQGRYQLIAGKRRLTAARLSGHPTIPAEVRDLSDAQARIAELTENLARRDLPAHREAEGVVELIRLRFDEQGMTLPPEEVRRILWRLSNERRGNVEERMTHGVENEVVQAVFTQIGRSFAAFVTGTLPALSWPENVREALERGLPKSAGQQLAQIKDDTLRAEALRRVEEGERPREVKAELLQGAREHRQLERDLTEAERLGTWPRDGGWLLPDLTLDVPAPSGMDVVPRSALIEELLSRARVQPGERVCLVYADLPDVLAALRYGVQVWSANPAPRFDGEPTRTPSGADLTLLVWRRDRPAEYGLTGEDAPPSSQILNLEEWLVAPGDLGRRGLLISVRDLAEATHLPRPHVLVGVEGTPGGNRAHTIFFSD